VTVLTTVVLVGAVRTVILSVTSQPQFNTRSIVTSELVGCALSWWTSRRSRFTSHTHRHVLH